MSCSRTQHGDACGDRTQDLSILSLTLYHYATPLPLLCYVLQNILFVFPGFMWTRFFADYSLMNVSNGNQSIEISLDINRLIGVIFSNEYGL